MANDAYSLQDYTTLDLQEEDGSTSMSIAGITNVEIVPAFTIEHLYTADSVKAETRKQFEFLGEITIGRALFDQNASVVQQWLGGSGGTSSTSLTDTSDPQTFSVSGTFDSVGGDRTLDVTVTGITFEEMPVFSGEDSEFVAWELSGQFEDMTDLSMTDNTTA